jgi:hypothetical protein
LLDGMSVYPTEFPSDRIITRLQFLNHFRCQYTSSQITEW